MTDGEVRDFVVISFSEYFKSISAEQNLTKVAKSLYIFQTTLAEVQSNPSDNCLNHYNVKILNFFDPELQLINAKQIIKNKLQALLNELKKFKVRTILGLHCKKRNDHKIFHSSTKLIASDSDIDEAFKPMH